MNYRRLHNNKTSIKTSVTHSIWNLFVNQTFWNMSHQIAWLSPDVVLWHKVKGDNNNNLTGN